MQRSEVRSTAINKIRFLIEMNKTCFKCKITDSLISEYGIDTDGVSTYKTYKGVYWEAAIYFDRNEFTLNVFTESADGVKEKEILKFPSEKIQGVKKYVVSYGKPYSKLHFIIGAVLGIIILLEMLINPPPGNYEFGLVFFFSLFGGFGYIVVTFMYHFFSPHYKNICIDLITCDSRVITLFADFDQEELVDKMLTKFNREVFWGNGLN